MLASFSATRNNEQTYAKFMEKRTFSAYFSQIIDKLVDFSLQKFCKKCKLCINEYEVSAISCDIEPSYEIKSVSNKPGIKSWLVEVKNALKLWVENSNGCSNCIAACPFSK